MYIHKRLIEFLRIARSFYARRYRSHSCYASPFYSGQSRGWLPSFIPIALNKRTGTKPYLITTGSWWRTQFLSGFAVATVIYVFSTNFSFLSLGRNPRERERKASNCPRFDFIINQENFISWLKIKNSRYNLTLLEKWSVLFLYHLLNHRIVSRNSNVYILYFSSFLVFVLILISFFFCLFRFFFSLSFFLFFKLVTPVKWSIMGTMPWKVIKGHATILKYVTKNVERLFREAKQRIVPIWRVERSEQRPPVN